MAKTTIQMTERPDVGALNLADRTAICLWNHGLQVLDLQRQIGSVDGQVELIERFIGLHTYAHAVRETSDGYVFTWLKGRELAIQRGVEENPPFMETCAIIIPSAEMVGTLMIAYGDCVEADRLRERAIRDEGEDAVRMSRELVTLISTEELYGPQPTVAGNSITLPR